MVSLFLVVDVFREDLLLSTRNTKFPKSRTGGTCNDLGGTLAAKPAVWSRGVSRHRHVMRITDVPVRFQDVAGNQRVETLEEKPASPLPLKWRGLRRVQEVKVAQLGPRPEAEQLPADFVVGDRGDDDVRGGEFEVEEPGMTPIDPGGPGSGTGRPQGAGVEQHDPGHGSGTIPSKSGR